MQSGERDSATGAEDWLTLVDEQDRRTGRAAKGHCHDGEGLLHRAFSVLLFNPAGELLLQQRAAAKRLWGGYWSNSCCSHPRDGEAIADAAERRVREELGLSVSLSYVYKFHYHARFGQAGAEHELCSVFVGCSQDSPAPDPDEVSAVRYIRADALGQELQDVPGHFTPWFREEWQRLQSEHSVLLRSLTRA
ncbi:isopentenyl-diphosphate Delta-isomerase [Granulosicoccaceae sp. 1_MG-2023]|nr:isopentenyl-diphosphate Delta-isomerase [Granulosicoccaceae sp. 1_MG-2023]